MSMLPNAQRCEHDREALAVQSLGLKTGGGAGYGHVVPTGSDNPAITMAGTAFATVAAVIAAFQRCNVLGA